ncbi:unnamed protein product [Paramecium sonneborni]|uniref:protein-serine/threonine phosphatase n=1 Tax=Paramecium sonneborni TaxID=65129 RepID=A0A8S1KZ65_9CILI|nr:unnamed protein product [Paramecium sonneborni]
MNQKNRETPSFLNKYLQKEKNPKRPFEFQVKQQEKQDIYGGIRKTIEQNFKSLGDEQPKKNMILPNYEPSKCSSGRNGIIKAYAANTNQGLIRDYNEDRVSIILNIVKPQNRQDENWPKCSFFGVYDGHGGSTCADFLRDNLHQFVIKENEFPWNPVAALKKGFEEAETHFLAYALDQYQKGKPERSGSCAIVCLVVGEICYVANVGDSRAVLSSQGGKIVTNLSIDHKPEAEKLRIQKGGGKIYQTHGLNEDGQEIVGPIRVMPGRLSVSRTFGDIEAKLQQFGGNSKVVISEPEIKIFKLNQDHDFIVMGSDGIFDKLNSEDVTDIIWKDLKNNDKLNLHSLLSQSVDSVLKEAIYKKSSDNITLLIIAFQINKSKEELQEFRHTISNSVDKIDDHFQVNNRPRLSQQMQRRNDENFSFFNHQRLNKQNTALLNNNKLNSSINLQSRLFRQLQSKKNIQEDITNKTNKHSYIL